MCWYYIDRVVVRLKLGGKFLIPMKDIASVAPVENSLVFCDSGLFHARATQQTDSVYIKSVSGCAPMGMLVSVTDSVDFIAKLEALIAGGGAEEAEEDDDSS